MQFLKKHPVLCILSTLILFGAAVNAFAPRQRTDVEWRSLSAGESLYCIATGSRDGKLLFVAIAAKRLDSLSENEGVESIVTGGGSVDENWHVLKRPDGTKESLPTDRQLFEQIDGKWREYAGHVTLDQWRGFLKSQPKEVTIEALLKWIEQDSQ